MTYRLQSHADADTQKQTSSTANDCAHLNPSIDSKEVECNGSENSKKGLRTVKQKKRSRHTISQLFPGNKSTTSVQRGHTVNVIVSDLSAREKLSCKSVAEEETDELEAVVVKFESSLTFSTPPDYNLDIVSLVIDVDQ